jgi:DNA-binding response OmpR family regulator
MKSFPDQEARNATILLVDSSDILRLFTARQLERGFPDLKVVTSRSCREARGLAEDLQPLLVIAQRRLPDGSGAGFVAELAGKGLACGSIIIGRGTDGPLCNDVAAAAVSAVLPEPYETRELIALGQRLLRDAGHAALVREDAAPVGAQDPGGLDPNAVINGLAGLVAGLRAFEAELRANLADPQSVLAIVNDNVELLVAAAIDLAGSVRRTHPASNRLG